MSNSTRVESLRVLAAHFRFQRFGFAVLQGPKRLLDWGVSAHVTKATSDPAATIRKRLASLFRIYAPSVLVLRGLSAQEGNRYSALNPLITSAKAEAATHSVEVDSVARPEIRQAFDRHEKPTKHEIAAQIAVAFPELGWKLPPRKHCWEREHHNMAIFDAVSLAVAYFERIQQSEIESP